MLCITHNQLYGKSINIKLYLCTKECVVTKFCKVDYQFIIVIVIRHYREEKIICITGIDRDPNIA